MPRGKPVKREAVDPALCFVSKRNAAVLVGTTLAEIDWLAGTRRLRPAYIVEAIEGNKETALLYSLADVLRAVRLREQESDGA